MMNKSVFEKYESKKSDSFKKNDALNNLLTELKRILFPIQKETEAKFTENKWPLGFIIGSPRSGSTLLLQWLASLGHFSYPSNVLNRFAYAPYLGALIQEILFNSKFDFHNEFSDLTSGINFNSDLGKSEGALASNEFQHFFRNYMPNFDPEYLDENTINKVNFRGIKQGLASIEQAFGKPFITKATMLQYNLDKFYSAIPNSIFLFISREPILNMQSILMARENYYSDREIWWSVKPKQYLFLKEMNIYHQIAGQVYFTNKEIVNAFKRIPEGNKIVIKYEKFCKTPKTFYDELLEKYKINGYAIKKPYKSIDFFNIRKSIKLSKNERKKFEIAYDSFNNNLIAH